MSFFRSTADHPRTSRRVRANERKRRTLRLELLEDRRVLASSPELLLDLNTTTGDSRAESLVDVNGALFFTAQDSSGVPKLWKSNGTESGTIQVGIQSGVAASNPGSLTNVGGTLFFSTFAGLWKSDGTENGTVLVKPFGSAPFNLVDVGGTLYFKAGGGSELWRSDGTEEGTYLFLNRFSSNLTNVGGMLYFVAEDAATGQELWKSDGTELGTVMVKDIRSGTASSTLGNLTNVNGSLFFRANDGIHGSELWKSDGTESGTVLVRDIRPGIADSVLNNIVSSNGSVYFTAADSGNDRELWKSDGTETGTVRVKDILPGLGGSFPNTLTDVSGTLFFVAADNIGGRELWKSDGTDSGTVQVKDMQPGITDSSLSLLTNVNGTLFFRWGNMLAKSDGTELGTVSLNVAFGNQNNRIVNVGGTAFFTGDDNLGGSELWKSDGTEAGTVRVKDINLNTVSSAPSNFVEFNGAVYFTADDGIRGNELWKTDGTEAGTVLVKDIYPGSAGSNATGFTRVDSTLYFRTDSNAGVELWKTDGTDAGTALVKNFGPIGGSLSEMANVNGLLFFSASDGLAGRELWKSDGTEAGTVRVKDIFEGNIGSSPMELTNFNGSLIFTAFNSLGYRELWKSDGTEAGTVRIKDIVISNPGANSTSLIEMDGALYFAASDLESPGPNDFGLWKSDGTDSGTVRIKNVTVDLNSEKKGLLTNVDGTLFFQAIAAAGFGEIELWKSDGTESGTVRISSILPSGFYNYLGESIAVNGTFFFTVPNMNFDQLYDLDLWKSDGTEAGTVKVFEITNGFQETRTISELTNVNGRLFFRAFDGQFSLWSSDGSIDGSGHGTFKIDPLPGQMLDFPDHLSNINGKLYFSANSRTTGSEPWTFDTFIPPAPPTDVVLTSSTLGENEPIGSLIGRLQSVDENYNEAFYYTLVPGAGDSDNASFTIDGNQLFSAASFDFETKASYSIRVRTTDLTGFSFERSLTISVTDIAESIPPIIGAFDTSVTFIENGTSVILDANATLTDSDSADFVGGVMTVSLIANSETFDRLAIRNQGTGAGQIGVAGNDVSFAGSPIATFVGGASGDEPLVITFAAGGSKAAAQALLRNLTFSTLSDVPSALPRTVQVQMNDGDGGESLPVAKSINITAVNDAPVIANFTGVASYTEGDAPVIVGPGATIADVDSSDFAAGLLTVRVLVNSQTTDRLSIRNDGIAPGDIGVSGSNVLYGNVVIGSFTGTTTLTATLNANANPAAVQALLRNVTFHSTSLSPSTLTRTISATLTDGDGGTSATVTTLVNVSGVNSAPTIGAFDTPVTYVENAAPVLLDINATVSDVDSLDFNGGILSVAITDNGENDDQLTVRNQGVAANQVGVVGDQLSFSGTPVGTLVGGSSGSDPLQIAFNASATPTAVQAVLRNIAFNHASQTPSTIARTVEVRLTDGDGGESDPVTKTVNVTAVNNAPIISNFSGLVSYTEGDGPVLIAATASVLDVDSIDFDLGRLTVGVSANTQSTDRITIANDGIAPGQIGVSGLSVTYGGVVIGTFTGTTTLIVTLNANASQAAVEALVANIAFNSLSSAPSTLPRTISASLTDGDGGASTTVTKTVQVFSANNDPVIGAFDTAVTYLENGLPVILDTNATVIDPDLVDFEDGVLTVSLTANGSVDDRLEIRNQGIGANQIGVNVDEVTFGGVVIGSFSGGTSSSEPLEILLNVSANQAAVQSLVRNLTFRNVSNAPSTLVRTVELQLTDGDGGSSVPVMKSINVTAVNDAPVISDFAGFSSYTEDELAVAIAIDAVVEDLDSADFDLGRLIASVSTNSQPTDRMTIRNDGTGLGEIGVSGSSVTYSGIVIGTFTGTTTLTVTLNAAANAAAVQALLRNLSFNSTSGAPSVLQRTITATLSDGDGGTSLAVTTLVEVVAVNDAPVVGAFTPNVTYVENTALLLIDSNATVTDVDSVDFDNGFMNVALTENGNADDRLSIRNQGSAANQIGVVGNQITFSGIIIATFAGGTSGSDPLQITLTAGATRTAVQSLIRNLTFTNVSDNPSTLPRTVTLTLNDGDGGTGVPVSKVINVTAVNDAPTIGGFGGNVGYTTGGPAVVLDTDATVEDPDNEAFNAGVLTVSLTTNRQTTDRIEILSVGDGIGEIKVLSNQVFYEGVLIGTFGGTTTLSVTLNSNASKAAVQKLLRSITFRSLSATPSLLPRTVSVTLSDGSGGTSLAQTKTVSMS